MATWAGMLGPVGGRRVSGVMMTVTYAQRGGGLLVDVLAAWQKGSVAVGGLGLSSSVTLTVTAMLPAAGGMPLRIWVAGSNARSSGAGLDGSVSGRSVPSANVAWYVRVSLSRSLNATVYVNVSPGVRGCP